MATIDEREDTIPTERIAYVIYILMDNRGQKFTTAELARMVDLEHNGTWKLLRKASRRVPIVQDIDGWWIE